MLIKYINSVLWRVAKRLSYMEDALCLKVNSVLELGEAPNIDWYQVILKFPECREGHTTGALSCMITLHKVEEVSSRLHKAYRQRWFRAKVTDTNLTYFLHNNRKIRRIYPSDLDFLQTGSTVSMKF